MTSVRKTRAHGIVNGGFLLKPALSLCSGSVAHSQMTSNTIVTMTMASHSSHATAVTTSAIPVGECWFVLCTSGHQRLHFEDFFISIHSYNFFDRKLFHMQLKWFHSPSPTPPHACSPTTQEREPTSSPSLATARPPTRPPWRPGATTGERTLTADRGRW